MSDDGFGPAMTRRDVPRRDRKAQAAAAQPAARAPEARHPDVQRSRRRPRIGRWLVIALLIYALGALLVAPYTSARINRVDVAGLSAGDPMHVLIIGSDDRGDLSDDELFALGTDRVDGDRSDTLMVLSVSGDRAAMLSLPRDLWVTRCDGSEGRINAAVSIGGLDCLVQTTSSLTGLPIAHVVTLDFAAFVRIVDAVGGVPLTLEAPLVDVPAGVDLPAGCSRVDGITALGFVRARNQPDGDLGRVQRQQQFISALAGEIATPSTLLNVPRLYATGGAAGAATTTDRGFGMGEALRVARAARSLAGGGVPAHTVPVTGQNVGGAAILVPTGDAEALFASFRDGSVLNQPSEPPPEETGARLGGPVWASIFAAPDDAPAPEPQPGC